VKLGESHSTDLWPVADHDRRHIDSDRLAETRTFERLLVDPRQCMVASLVARDPSRLGLEAIKDLAASFITEGQLQPVLGRRIQPAHDTADFEVVVGVRRLLAAQWLRENGHPDFNIWLDTIDLSDRDVFITIDRENAAHATLSPWERARSMRRALESDLFKTQREMAEALKERPATVSTLVRLADWPDDLVAAFPSPFDILMVDAERLAPIVDDPKRKEALLQEARRIRTEQVTRNAAGKALRTRVAVLNALRRAVRIPPPKTSGDCISANIGKLPDGTRNLIISIRLPTKHVIKTLEEVRKHIVSSQNIEPSHEPRETYLEMTHPLLDFIEAGARTVSLVQGVTTS
jgi:ParB/RepB/Spo0J family partition protein